MQPESPGGDEHISQAEGDLVREPAWAEETGRRARPGWVWADGSRTSLRPNLVPLARAASACLGVRRNEAAGGLRADGHEAAVESHYQQVQTQPQRQEPDSRQAPVDTSRRPGKAPGKAISPSGCRRSSGTCITCGQVGITTTWGRKARTASQGLLQRRDRPLWAGWRRRAKQQPGGQPGQDGDQQDHSLVRHPAAVRRSAGAEDEQDQGKQGEGDLDVMAVDLGSQGEDLIFH